LIAFTAGVGENSPVIRQMVLQNMRYLGVRLDDYANCSPNKNDRLITTSDSNVQSWVIPANEELMIAQKAMYAIGK